MNDIQLPRKLQIGVMGSAQDLEYAKEIEEVAFEVGKEVARNNAILFFGAEKDYDSLSTVACRGAKSEGGLTVGVTYGIGKDVVEFDADVIVSPGCDRGGPREAALVLSCDAVISVSGGSGTLNELVVAYQAGIPSVALRNTGGWSEKMAGQFFDARKRMPVYSAENPLEAVTKAVIEGSNYLVRSMSRSGGKP